MRNDLAVGLLALLLAGVYYYFANEIPRSLLVDQVGADGLPKLYAVALASLSVLLIAQSLLSRAAAADDARFTLKDLPPHLRALGLLALGAGYLLLISSLGYLFTVFLLLFAAALYAGTPFNFKLVFVSAGGGLLLWVMFVKLFNIPLPSGTLWRGFAG